MTYEIWKQMNIAKDAPWFNDFANPETGEPDWMLVWSQLDKETAEEYMKKEQDQFKSFNFKIVEAA